MEQVELVFIPAIALSHIMATVATAELLLSRAERRLSATVLIMNPFKDTMVDTYLEKISSSSNPHLRFIKLPPPEDSPSPSLAFMFEYIESRAAEVRQIISNLIEKQSPAAAPPRVAGVVLDFFTTNFIDVANEFGIPAYVFNPTSACNLGLSLHPAEVECGGGELSVPYLSVPLPAKVLPLRCVSETGCVIGTFLRFFRRLSEVKGIMTNTFYELEPYAIDELNSDDKGPKVYAVGPVLTAATGGGGGGDDEVTRWLDKQPEKAVVFLCFGSMGSLVGEQVREIALALENGGFRFLWSLRGGAAAAELPEGFLERTGGVGRVIGWAAQTAVLAHTAVGCFVSHCGWNSTLESVWFGVPIATFPLFGEQHLNAFELVQELKLAEAITLDYVMDFTWEKAPEIVGAEKIEAAIRQTMAAEGVGVRGKVEEMQKKAKRALMEGGSSYIAQTLFIEDVFTNIKG